MRRIALLCVTWSLAACADLLDTEGGRSPLTFAEAVQDGYVTAEECEAAGHEVIGDVGNGHTQKDTFRCADGERPLAKLLDDGIEGGVCCAK